MAQQVFPTKSNLMATKRSLALATQGYDLMDRKRNILVREMMQLIDRAAGIQDRISTKLKEANIHNAISARVKHIYSIYRKMYAQHKTINEIYDICAVRVIVDTVADCYNVLGYVHDLYKPIPGPVSYTHLTLPTIA